ncbi:MAG: hypothetical protein KDA64_10195 [Rhodospirillaceae bacterium]|nr:hypothetical protein [Rhodospirillaceae bacterium]
MTDDDHQTETPTETPPDISADMDAIERLPLSIIPLETKALRRATLIKNMALDGVVEMFQAEGSGSGQLKPAQLPTFFGWPEGKRHPDMLKLERLAELTSYDVYSLRIELRRLDIPLDEVSVLKLSPEKASELTRYMKTFTEPLIRQVYGGTHDEIRSFDDIIAMFSRPNKQEALRNLRMIAERLKVELIDVPRFLEDYGDVFLSLAYFKQYLDRLGPQIDSFLTAAGNLKKTHQLKMDRRFMASVELLETELAAILTSITGRFDTFNRRTGDMWRNITADSFRRVRNLITAHHISVGGVLCGLSVKMNAWRQRFGHYPEGAALLSRGDFIMGEMRQGIERIRAIETSAPRIP